MPRRYVPAFALSAAAHLLLALLLAGPPVAPPGDLGEIPGKAMTVFNVAPPEDATFPGLNPVDRSHDEWARLRGGESPTLKIDEITIDLDRIRAHVQVLFPFMTPGLSLENFLPGPADAIRAQLQNPLTAERRARERSHPPLAMTDAAVQALIDKTWARHERWAAFEPISELAGDYSAGAGQLSAIVRQYVDQNSLQPYADTKARDPRLWAQLGIAADHATFIAFIRRFAAGHPSTRTTTELLFLLDRLAEANQDALSVLRDSNPPDDLSWTRQTHSDAFRLVTGIRWYYAREADRLGLNSDEAVGRFYEKVRLSILDSILRTTPDGYRSNDARFLIGAIHWRQRNVEEALAAWRGMTPQAGDSYFIVSSQILAALRGPRELRREIDRILKNQQGRWLAFSDDRLRRFGYRFDTF